MANVVPPDDDLRATDTVMAQPNPLRHAHLFSVDANVLLNLYRYTPRTRDHLLNILDGLRDYLWITDQAVKEFYENRPKVIADQQRAYDQAIAELNGRLAKTRDWIQARYARHSGIDTASLDAMLSKLETEMAENIEATKMHHPNYNIVDPILERAKAILAGRSGDAYGATELAAKLTDAQARFDRRQPPGFDDVKKAGDRQFGDVVLWFQLLDKAMREPGPIIFVTDDRKEDWWLKRDDEIIAPHPDLVSEMEAAGSAFRMLVPEQFMTLGEALLGITPLRDATDEVRDISYQIMYLEGRDGSMEHGGGWAGIGMYRQIKQRDVAAALRLGIRNIDEIREFNHEKFWIWAKDHGLSTRASINILVGYEAEAMTLWEMRAAIESQPVERYQGAEQQALRDFLAALGSPYTYQLEQTLGQTIGNLSTAEVQALVRAHLALSRADAAE